MIHPATIETCRNMLRKGTDEDVGVVNAILKLEPEAVRKALCIELNDSQDKFHYGFDKGKIVKVIPKFPVLPFNPE